MDRLYRYTRVNPGMPHCWLIGVMRARLAYRGRLVWVTKVGRLGGPRPGALLVRIREIGLDGATPMGPEDEAREAPDPWPGTSNGVSGILGPWR